MAGRFKTYISINKMTPETEFNLSEKEQESITGYPKYSKTDVKEFIRLLKAGLDVHRIAYKGKSIIGKNTDIKIINEIIKDWREGMKIYIDKLAGDKLII